MPASRSQRILSLDLLRGYFLIVILIDHLAKFPGFFELFTGKGWLWVSAAEGFFIISGLMVGLIRGREAQKMGFRSAWKRLWSRGANLYIWSISLTALFTLIAWQAGNHPGVKDGLAAGVGIPDLLIQILTLQYIYGWADFLAYYAVFMIFAPIALWLTLKGKAWVALLMSLQVWLFRGDNVFASLQILFIGGLVVGHYLPAIEGRISTMSLSLKRFARNSIYAVTVTALGFSAIVVHGKDLLKTWGDPLYLIPSLEAVGSTMGPWFDKWTMAPGRVILVAIWFTAIYVLFRQNERRIANLFGWLLIPLGRNSQQTYIIQSFMVFTAWLIWPGSLGLALNILLNLVAIGVLTELIYVYAYGRVPGYPPAKYWKQILSHKALNR